MHYENFHEEYFLVYLANYIKLLQTDAFVVYVLLITGVPLPEI